MRYFLLIVFSSCSIWSQGQIGELVYETESTGGYWFRPFNDSLCMVHNNPGYYFLLNGRTGEVSVLDDGNYGSYWGFSWVQQMSPNNYVICTGDDWQGGETMFLVCSADGTFRVLNHSGNEGTKIFYSKIFEDDESYFMIKGSPKLEYYNLVRLDNEYNPISEDTLIQSSEMPEDMGYPYYGNYNGRYFVFSGRNTNYDEGINHNVYSIDLESKKLENLTRWQAPEGVSNDVAVTNILVFNGDFYFQWLDGSITDGSGFYRSTGEFKGTEFLFSTPYTITSEGMELVSLNLPINMAGDMFIDYNPDNINNNCDDHLMQIREDGTQELFNIGINFFPTRDVAFLGDSLVFIFDSDGCTDVSDRSPRVLELNIKSNDLMQLDSIPPNLKLGFDINETWAMIENSGSYENHHYYLFHKSSRSFFLFEHGITHDIGEDHFFGSTPKPDNTYSQTVWISNGYVYYSINASIYRQPLPQVSSVREKKSQSAFEVYPNPTGKGYVEIKTSIRNGQFYWLNLQGQLVGSGSIKNTNPRIKTPKSPGLYLLQIADDNGGSLQRKVIVK